MEFSLKEIGVILDSPYFNRIAALEFDTKKIDEYAAQAKTMWGKTEAFREFTEKRKSWSKEDQQQINLSFME